MIYEQFVTTNKSEFLAKVQQIAALLRIDVDSLMVVMYAESRLKPTAHNPLTNATGLIQFMPSTARGLGTTVDALLKMSNVQQLDYVYAYFKAYTGRIVSVFDLYKIVFFPIMLGRAKDWVLQSSTLSASVVANANRIIDINKDGQITVAEFEQYVSIYLKKKLVSKQPLELAPAPLSSLEGLSIGLPKTENKQAIDYSKTFLNLLKQ